MLRTVSAAGRPTSRFHTAGLTKSPSNGVASTPTVTMATNWPGNLAGRQADLHRLFALFLSCPCPAGPATPAPGGLLFGTILGRLLGHDCRRVGRAGHSPGDAAHGTARVKRSFDRLRRRVQLDGFTDLLVLRLLAVLPFWLVSLLPVLVRTRPESQLVATVGGTRFTASPTPCGRRS